MERSHRCLGCAAAPASAHVSCRMDASVCLLRKRPRWRSLVQFAFSVHFKQRAQNFHKFVFIRICIPHASHMVPLCCCMRQGSAATFLSPALYGMVAPRHDQLCGLPGLSHDFDHSPFSNTGRPGASARVPLLEGPLRRQKRGNPTKFDAAHWEYVTEYLFFEIC